MVKRNAAMKRLQENYLFFEISRRKETLLKKQPQAQIINLGIGDTTQPLPPLVVESFIEKAKALGTADGYTGYGDAFGHPLLREGIAKTIYKGLVAAEDIFISDGAKCDLGRLQLLWGGKGSLAIQDPAYPVYIATSVMTGKTGEYDARGGGYQGIVYMPCLPQDHFFPDLERLPHSGLIYLCSPNNPTGNVFTHRQLEKLLAAARERNSLIIFDSAYASFIRDPSLPRSIYEIDGAEDRAIEIGSFSKWIGFTGVRLGWTVVPKTLCFDDGSSIQKDWMHIMTTFFNGASNLAQAGGIALMNEEGLEQSQQACNYYLENTHILRSAVESRGYACFGGDNAPYLWVDIQGQNSWDLFDKLLCKGHIITIPGLGFGPSGEGFLRLSGFGKRCHVEEAAARIRKML